MIEQYGILPTRIIRYCCRELKEIGGNNRIVMTGIRSTESTRRSSRKVYERSRQQKNTWFLHPIIDWSVGDVWDYLALNKISHCSLYDEGKTRIGCIMCPMQGASGMLADKERFPKYYRAYLRAIDRMLIKLKRDGKTCTHGETAEDIMYWWIHNSDNDTTTRQLELSNEVE